MTYQAIIIDDEELGRVALREKLKTYCKNITVIGEAANGKLGKELIKEVQPDLVFLDIEMPVMNGFEMLETIDSVNFQLIFVTAYDQYAIKAIKYSALDYLLKPVDIEELQQAIARLNTIELNNVNAKVAVLNANQKLSEVSAKIAIPVIDGYQFIVQKDIVRLESDKNYTKIFLHNATLIVASKTLKDFEEMLSSNLFFRCHHSHIINIHFIDRYIKGEGGQIILNNKIAIPVSRRKKDDFMKWIKVR